MIDQDFNHWNNRKYTVADAKNDFNNKIKPWTASTYRGISAPGADASLIGDVAQETRIVNGELRAEYKKDDAYIHFCLNETVHGVEYFDDPNIKNVPIVCDMSSTILSRPIDVSSYGVIYAGAQKNIGPAGLTVLIVRDDLLDFADKKTPSTLSWKIQSENNSMINTPSLYGIYIAGLVLDWLLQRGGLDSIEKINLKKSNYLYDFIDSTDFYINNVDKINRSRMNVAFNIYNDELTSEFLVGAEKNGLFGLKGHRIIGGLRASIYNAMPFEGLVALVDYMKEFKNTH